MKCLVFGSKTGKTNANEAMPWLQQVVAVVSVQSQVSIPGLFM